MTGGRVREEGAEEALMRTVKVEMGRRKDLIDWVEELGGGTERDWEGLNRAMEALGAGEIRIEKERGEGKGEGDKGATKELVEKERRKG